MVQKLALETRLWLKQRYFVVREKNNLKIFEQISNFAYPHVILFTKHEKDTATVAYIKPSQISMMELFMNSS